MVGSSRSNEGEVEVYRDNSWKKVCKDHWTLTEANVVCHELGYLNAVSFKGTNSEYTSTAYPFLNLRIKCTGGEKKLSQCFHEEKDRHFCTDGAVKVRCEGKEGGKAPS